jgi:hypothetical protein
MEVRVEEGLRIEVLGRGEAIVDMLDMVYIGLISSITSSGREVRC